MAAEAPPRSDKQLAADALARMPESATLAEITERLAVMDALARGHADLDAGRAVSHDEAERKSRVWTTGH